MHDGSVKRLQNLPLWTGAILILGLAVIASINPRYVYTGDSLIKLMQARSLIENRFSSEEVYYPARDLDPSFKYAPFTHPMMLTLKDRRVFQYPVLFAALSGAILALFGPLVLPFLSLFCFVFVFWFTVRHWSPSWIALFSGFLGTALCLYSFQYSEIVFFATSLFVGITLFLRAPINTWTSPLVGGCLLGLAAWFRPEAIVFGSALGIGYAVSVRPWKVGRVEPRAWGFAGGVVLVTGAFLLFNYLNYGHPFGPRYMANFGPLGLGERAVIARTILFAGNFKIGFLVYTPLFLLALLLGLLPAVRAQLPESGRILHIMLCLAIPAIAFTSPNDGVADWGARFLMGAVLPATVLLDQVLVALGATRRMLRVGVVVLFVFSLLPTIAGYVVLRNATRQLRAVQRDIGRVKADLLLFQDSLLMQHIGLSYFDRQALLVEHTAGLDDLIKKLKDRHPGETIAYLEPRPMMSISPRFAELIREYASQQKIRAGYGAHLKAALPISRTEALGTLVARVYTIPGTPGTKSPKTTR